MDKELKTALELLRSLRPQLIDILSAGPDFIRQRVFSNRLVTNNGYKAIGSQQTPMQQVTTLLDQIHDRGPEDSRRLLVLLKSAECQKTFPKLSFLLNIDLALNLSTEETSKEGSAEEPSSTNPPHKRGPELVTEKQLMKVADAMGLNWKEVGILVLGIKSNKLDEIEAENNRQKMRAFRMLLHWRCLQKQKATAANLYSLLSNEALALSPECLQSLQESS